ncbi:MAG TPA: thermonuclease family protein [Hyphomonas sp.]|nr:thermonuclease family protein [Hyphomonas sp.]
MARGIRLKEWAIAVVVLAGIALGIALAAQAATGTGGEGTAKAVPVYWSDGDSGRHADGSRFRLHGVDAPETGSTKWYRGAKCEAERELGYAAKAHVLELTRGKTVTVTHEYGPDAYGRRVVDLAVEGQDLAALLVADGTHQVWDYDGGDPKPLWCTGRTVPDVAGP